MNHQSEAQIKKAVMDLLKARGIMCFRMQSGNTFMSYKGKTRRIMGNPSGTADLLFHVSKHGYILPVWCELKRVGARQSPEQKVFQEMVEKAAHYYLIIHSASELEEWLVKNT